MIFMQHAVHPSESVWQRGDILTPMVAVALWGKGSRSWATRRAWWIGHEATAQISDILRHSHTSAGLPWSSLARCVSQCMACHMKSYARWYVKCDGTVNDWKVSLSLSETKLSKLRNDDGRVQHDQLLASLVAAAVGSARSADCQSQGKNCLPGWIWHCYFTMEASTEMNRTWTGCSASLKILQVFSHCFQSGELQVLHRWALQHGIGVIPKDRPTVRYSMLQLALRQRLTGGSCQMHSDVRCPGVVNRTHPWELPTIGLRAAWANHELLAPCEIVDVVDVVDRWQRFLQCAAAQLVCESSPVRLSDAQMSALDGLATLSETTHNKMLPSWREASWTQLDIAGYSQTKWSSVGHFPLSRWNWLKLKRQAARLQLAYFQVSRKTKSRIHSECAAVSDLAVGGAHTAWLHMNSLPVPQDVFGLAAATSTPGPRFDGFVEAPTTRATEILRLITDPKKATVYN